MIAIMLQTIGFAPKRLNTTERLTPRMPSFTPKYHHEMLECSFSDAAGETRLNRGRMTLHQRMKEAVSGEGLSNIVPLSHMASVQIKNQDIRNTKQSVEHACCSDET